MTAMEAIQRAIEPGELERFEQAEDMRAWSDEFFDRLILEERQSAELKRRIEE